MLVLTGETITNVLSLKIKLFIIIGRITLIFFVIQSNFKSKEGAFVIVLLVIWGNYIIAIFQPGYLVFAFALIVLQQ